MEMMSEFFASPADIVLDANRPLLIVDADEVLLRFAAGFDQFLAERGCYLSNDRYLLLGNVFRQMDNAAVPDAEITNFLEAFRDRFDTLEAVNGAVEATTELADLLDIVVLSNIVADHAPARLRNLANLGMGFPLVINSGLKGPAVKMLAARSGKPVFFVDDIPRHLASAAEDAPDVFRIHLVGDARFKTVRPFAEHAHLCADNWQEVTDFIRAHLTPPR